MERPDGILLNAAVCACKAQGGSGPGAIKQKVPPSDEICEREKENNLSLKVLSKGSW